MTVQAAIDSIGVAIGHTACVADDMAKGRLVVPFDIPLPTRGLLFRYTAGQGDGTKTQCASRLAEGGGEALR